MSSERDTKWENKVAEDLSKTGYRDLASIGREPTLKEKIQFGVLQGNYSVEFNNKGFLVRADFLEGNIETPKFAENRIQLIEDIKKVLPVEMVKAESVSKLVTDNDVTEVYEILSKSGDKAKVIMKLDKQDRLLSLSVKKL